MTLKGTSRCDLPGTLVLFETVPMAAYLFVNIEVKDQTAYAEYRSGVSPMIHKHGGEYLARGGAAELIEGDWAPNRVGLLKFPDMEALKAVLDEPDYQPLKDFRLRAAHSQKLGAEWNLEL